MSANISMNDNERAWVVPVLHELQKDGTVDRTENWSELRKDVLGRLDDYGAQNAESLLQPLDEAIEQGNDYKAVAEELSAEYMPPTAEESQELDQFEPEVSDELSPSSEDAGTEPREFEAMLPAADELAQAIVTDLGAELGQLIDSDPKLAAALDANTLVDWVTEDLAAVIDQLAASEQAWLV